MFTNPKYNNSPAHYIQCLEPESLYYTPVTHIKGNKTLTPSGRARITSIPIQEQHIFNFLLQKSNNQNKITFSKDLFLKYKGYVAHFILKPSPDSRGQVYLSYMRYKEAIISLLKKHFIIKPYESKSWAMINPAYGYSSYRGIPSEAAKFAKEYAKLVNSNSLSSETLAKMCEDYITISKIKVNWGRNPKY